MNLFDRFQTVSKGNRRLNYGVLWGFFADNRGGHEIVLDIPDWGIVRT